VLDFSQVERFALRLRAASEVTFEDEWEDEWGQKAAQQVSASAPRLTGRLAGSVRYSGDGEVDITVPYWPYVEYGTSRTAPQPFVRPAVNRLAPQAAADVGRRATRI